MSVRVYFRLISCVVHNIATRENFDFVKNDPENTDLQGKNRVFLGIFSRLQLLFFTSCYIMNRTGEH